MKKAGYVGFVLVFVASILAAVFLPVAEPLQTIMAVPAIGSLCAALVQIVRDNAAHERAVLTQDVQNSFVLGATSHMATVAFDKYAAFCEAYVTEMFATLLTMFREGPTRELLTHTSNLWNLRQKWAVWLPSGIDAQLEIYEAAIRKVGAFANVTDPKTVEATYELFGQVTGIKMGEAPVEGELAVSKVIGKLKTVLGTEDLTAVRSALVAAAAARSVRP